MGCDIHIFSETKKDGVWVNNEEFVEELFDGEEPYIHVPYDDQFYNGRDYNLFGVLAGVRAEDLQQFEVKGFPADASPLVAKNYESWGVDAHTPSYLTLEELKALKLDDTKVSVTGMMKSTQWEMLRDSISTGTPDWGLLYPHCGWTNGKDYTEFQVMVPIKVLVDDSFERFLSCFDHLGEGEHRVVFWFDN